MPRSSFPRDFVWGVATAAPQIEGAAAADGKGPSVWDTFSRVPGKVLRGDTLDVACDHYHRFPADLRLIADLGIRHYRLSLAWPRIFPAGRGVPNPRGLDFYDRLIDAALARGITPWVTMFHWDLPQALEDTGGWRVRSTAEAFGAYAETIVRRYGDRVKRWITLNEILCFTGLGYGGGDKAPGTDEGPAVVNQTFHHALVAHGLGVRAVREFGGRGARVGLTDNPWFPVPVTETAADIAAARQLFEAKNARVLGPIFRGHYDAAYLRAAGGARPKVGRGDFALISAPTDFLGLNVYSGYFVRAGRAGKSEILPLPANFPTADSPWLHHLPQLMYWGPRLARDAYGVKNIYITENGAGYDDPPPVRGEILDLHRREFLRAYLRELERAVGDGIPVRGYFLWSLLDNFEWQDGYTRRFGIVYTDYRTQRRTPKLSARWYSQVAASGRIV